MQRYTDVAAELYAARVGNVPRGVSVQRFTAAGIPCTRVVIARSGLRRPVGTYITLELPSFAQVNETDEDTILCIAHHLRTLLPASGTVLVAGIGNAALSADALGPRTAQRVLATRGKETGPELCLRTVAVVTPGVQGVTGIATHEALRSLVAQIKPAAVVCIDALFSAQAQRLGCMVQLSTAGLSPRSAKPLTQQTLGVPVVAVGVPCVTEIVSKAHAPIAVTPKEIDIMVSRGAQLLSLALNKALQPALGVDELAFLTS